MHYRFAIIKRTFALVLLSGLLLPGCMGSGNTVRYYLVNPVDFSDVSNAPEKKLAIEILDLHVPQYLEHLHIAVRTGENSLQFSEFNQWGENLRKNLMQTMVRNLAGLLSTSDISTPLNRSSSTPDFQLEIHIDQFEKDSDGMVRLAARWQLINAASGEPLGIRSADLTGRDHVPDRDYDRMVGEMKDLYGQLSRMIADDIVQAAGS